MFIRIVLITLVMIGITSCSGASNTEVDVLADTPTPTPTPTPIPTVPDVTQPEEPVITASLFNDTSATGNITVTLHPQDFVVLNSPLRFTFGVPFPRKTINDLSQIAVIDNSGTEIPADVTELARWRSLDATIDVDSLRSVMIEVEVVFTDYNPKTYSIRYGSPRSQNLAGLGTNQLNWMTINNNSVIPDEYNVTENIKEPSVYATFTPQWLSICLIRTRTFPVGENTKLKWFDDSVLAFSNTAVNIVSPLVTEANRIDYENKYAPWLFDRAMTLYGTYLRTGDIKWLRHAHRATQFYANHIDSVGNFDLKGTDLKYGYGEAMFANYMFTGDTTMLPKIELVASRAVATWNPIYTFGKNFWTERHQTYALLAALSAWESTGAAEHKDRVMEVVNASFDLALNPVNGWTNDGCMLHTLLSHEGGGTNSSDPICSPWMSALFADAIWRYYIHSEDDNALIFLANLADYVQNISMRPERVAGAVYDIPWYLASSARTFTNSGPFADWEHSCDVAGLVSKGIYAKIKLGQSAVDLKTTVDGLTSLCEAVLDNWMRPTGPDFGKSVWRLSPPRKFSWWFGTTSDLGWFIQ